MLELDVTEPDHVAAVRDALGRRWAGSTARSTPSASRRASCLGGDFIDAPWEDVTVALQISAYSLKTLADVVVPLMTEGGSIVGLDFDASRQAWPAYDWMGVAKAALEIAAPLPRPRPRPAALRVNLVAAGPVRTMAAKSIPGFALSRTSGTSEARSAGTSSDASAVARSCVALLSDWFPTTTGEIVHVDGGYHSTAV